MHHVPSSRHICVVKLATADQGFGLTKDRFRIKDFSRVCSVDKRCTQYQVPWIVSIVVKHLVVYADPKMPTFIRICVVNMLLPRTSCMGPYFRLTSELYIVGYIGENISQSCYKLLFIMCQLSRCSLVYQLKNISFAQVYEYLFY